MNDDGEKAPAGPSSNSSNLPVELTDPQRDIEFEIDTILNTSKRWSLYLQRKERRKRILYAVLSGTMVWVAFLILLALQDDLNYSITGLLSSFFRGGNSITNYLVFLIFPVSVVVAIVSYIIQMRIKSPFAELEVLIGSFHSASKGERSAVSALSILEKMIRLLPEMKKMRYTEASLYGLIAFLLSLLITAKSSSFGIGISVLVGVLIWIYFRYEATIEYGRELSRFEKWQEKLEEQKKEFIANL
ncbi:MAG: hypothetical protein ACRECH_14580 [Nitrososphaerales archaeon]